MNYAAIKPVDIANGPGVRVSLFVSGCTHHCEGCFNAQAWDFDYGEAFTEETERKLLELLNHDFIAGLTLLGGEPLEPENQKTLVPFLKKVRERFPEKSIWCYSGYEFEKDVLGWMLHELSYAGEFMSLIDVLVDGRFVQAKKNISLKFRGSENQRILDVRKSMEEKQAVWLAEYAPA